MMGMDFCTTNFRNYRSLKDSSGPRCSRPFPDRAVLCAQVQGAYPVSRIE